MKKIHVIFVAMMMIITSCGTQAQIGGVYSNKYVEQESNRHRVFYEPSVGNILYCYGNITIHTQYVNAQGRETNSGMNSRSVNLLYPSYSEFQIGGGSLYPQYSVYTTENKSILSGAIVRNYYNSNPTSFKIIKITGSLIEVIRLQ